MQKKNYAKKLCSLLLAVLMCLSAVALDFTGLDSALAPTADAATAGTYNVVVSVSYTPQDGSGAVCSDTWGEASMSGILYYKAVNGTGTESTVGFGSGGYSNSSLAGFPSRVNISVMNASATVTIEVNEKEVFKYTWTANGSWCNHTTGSGSNETTHLDWSNKSFSETRSVDNQPTISSIKYETAPTEATANKKDGGNASAVFKAVPKDQYGVTMQDTVTWSVASDNWGGCSMSDTSDSATLYIPATTNQINQKNVTVRATCQGKTGDATIAVYPTKIVNYYPNTGTLVNAKTDTYTKNGNNSFTIPSSYSATKTGYLFQGWNTNPNATTATASGKAYDFSGGVTNLYAIWKPINYTFNYLGNNNTNTATTMTSSVFTYDVQGNLTANAFEKQYWTYFGWGTSDDDESPVYQDKQAIFNLTATHNTTYNIYALYYRDIGIAYKWLQENASDFGSDVTDSKRVYNNTSTTDFTSPDGTAITTVIGKDDKTWTLKGWEEKDTVTWGGATQTASVGLNASHNVNVTGANGGAHTFNPVYALTTTKFYANFNFYTSTNNTTYSHVTMNHTVNGDAATGAMPVATVSDDGANRTVAQYYSKNGIVYRLVGWSLTENSDTATTAFDEETVTLNVPGAGTPTSTANLTAVELYPVYERYATAVDAYFYYYKDGGELTYEKVSGSALGEATTATIKYPDSSNIQKTYTQNGRTYELVGWSHTENQESGNPFNYTQDCAVLENPTTMHHDFYPVYKTATVVRFMYTTATSDGVNYDNDTINTENYVERFGETYGGTADNANTKISSIAVPAGADEDLASFVTYKYRGLTYELIGWEKQAPASLDLTSATFAIGQAENTTEKVSDDGTPYVYYPVYRIVNKDVVSHYHYYDDEGADRYFEIITPDIARANTSATVTFAKATDVDIDYTTKLNNNDVTYTLLGWNQNPASTDEIAFEGNDTVTGLNDNTVSCYDFYPVYQSTTTVRYFYYDINRAVVSGTKTTVDKKADNTVPSATAVDMLTDGITDITLDTRTFTLIGWSDATHTTSAYPTDVKANQSVNVPIMDAEQYWYGVYENDLCTLSYDGAVKATCVSDDGTVPPEQTNKPQYLSAVTGAADTDNATLVTFDIYDADITPTKYGYTFCGWDLTNSELETAQYPDTDKTATISVKVNTTLYARFTVNSYKVTFKYYDGEDRSASMTLLEGYTAEGEKVSHDDLTRDDSTTNTRYVVTAPTVSVVGVDDDGKEMPVVNENVVHCDNTYHYVFSGWSRNDKKKGDETGSSETNGLAYTESFKNITKDVIIQAMYKTYSHRYVNMTDDEVKKLGIEGETRTYRPANCFNDGYQWVKCTVCGWTYKKPIPKLDHKKANGTSAINYADYEAPTCTTAGVYATANCTICGTVMTDNDGNTLYYDFDAQTGTYKAVTSEDGVIAALGHDYIYVETFAPSCTKEGYELWVCSRDETHTEKRDLKKELGHKEVNVPAKEATCFESGYTAYVGCSVCGAQITVPEITEPLGHSFVLVEAKAVTCLANGNKAYYECTRCHGKYSENVNDETKKISDEKFASDYVIATTGHHIVEVAKAEAKCLEDGNEAYYQCTNCLEKYKDSLGAEVLTDEEYAESYVIGKLGHAEGISGESVASTCAKQGHSACIVCSRCGEPLVEGALLPLAEHQFTVLVTAEVPATCTKDGTTAVYKCIYPDCTAGTVGGEVITHGGHSWSDWSVYKQVSCTEDGLEKRECINEGCDEVQTQIYEHKLNHKFNDTPDEAQIDATCMAEGKTAVYKCQNKDCTYTKGGNVIEKKAHDFGAWVTVTNATCTAAGTQERTCQNALCQAKETRSYPSKAGHLFGAWTVTKAATCTDKGEMQRKCQRADCTTPGGYVETKEIAALGHIYQNVNEVAATCTKDGATAGKKCTRAGCGDTQGIEVIPKTNHEGTTVEVKGYAATCTTTGLTDGVRCTVCGTFTVAQTVLALVDHTEVQYIAAKTADCKEAGCTEGTKCAVCGKILKQSVIIAKLEHTEEEIPAVKATCLSDGTTAGIKCAKCGYIIKATVLDPKTGHNYTEWEITPSTCTDKGSKTRKCTNEGCNAVETKEIAPLGHHPVLVKAIAASCTKDGQRAYYTCSTCKGTHYYKTADCVAEYTASELVVSAYNHDYKVIEEVPVGCTQNGYTKKQCTICKAVVTENVIQAPGHKGGKATCKAAAVCTVCGNSYGTVDKGAHVYGEQTVKDAGDCRHRMTYTQTCTLCGHENVTFGGFGEHQLSEPVVTKEPTCTSLGRQQRTCSVAGCTEVIKEDIPMVDHVDSDGDYYCDVCKGIMPGSVIDHTGVCDKCGRVHTSNGGLYGYDGILCKMNGFFSIFKLFAK